MSISIPLIAKQPVFSWVKDATQHIADSMKNWHLFVGVIMNRNHISYHVRPVARCAADTSEGELYHLNCHSGCDKALSETIAYRYTGCEHTIVLREGGLSCASANALSVEI